MLPAVNSLFLVCHLSFDFIYGMFLFPEHSNFYLIKCITHVTFGFIFVFCIEKNFLSQLHMHTKNNNNKKKKKWEEKAPCFPLVLLQYYFFLKFLLLLLYQESTLIEGSRLKM